MTDDDPTHSENRNAHDGSEGAVRKPRAIRFSDSEWDEVKKAAEDRGVPAAEYVRETILDTARNPIAVGLLAIPADLVPLIERTFRYTYMLATKMRDDLTHDGQDDKLEYLIEEAPQIAGHPPERRSETEVNGGGSNLKFCGGLKLSSCYYGGLV